ncbi:MAG: hypothetical protein J6J23_06875 [Clostridia bacterium]|nr:hypothetical protein [Clostridia bacterium]
MRKVLSVFCAVMICVLSSVLLTGCVEKTYKLVGIADVENDKVVYYDDLDDGKKAIVDKYKDYTIKLGFNEKITINFKIVTPPSVIEYTITGKYKIEGNVLNISYTFEDGTTNTIPQQYSNGRIIYYDETQGVYLIFE